MEREVLYTLLRSVANGELTPDAALEKINLSTYEDIGFANVDTSRGIRQGAGEVIYGAGKTKEQIEAITQTLLAGGQKAVLITRVDKEKLPPDYTLYDEDARFCLVGEQPQPTGKGKIVVVCAGTSDLYCAKEAALTAEALGNEVECLFDVGVAGIHRLLDKAETLLQARVVIAVAGMEGALASVVGGLVSCPVIAVPTSVGYGASFDGLTALLAMLNSCASNVSVVNIDNGFGAGYIASMMNHL